MPLTFTIYLLFGNGIRINFKQTTMIIDGRNEQGRVQTVDGIRQTALRKKNLPTNTKYSIYKYFDLKKHENTLRSNNVTATTRKKQ